MTLEQLGQDFDRLVLATPEIDCFCSSTAWIVPAHQAFHPTREPWIWQNGEGAIAMARTLEPRGRYPYLEPLESSWLLASPFVGSVSVVDEFARRLPEVAPVAFLSGLAEGSELYRAVVRSLSLNYRLQRGPETVRHVASLEGGLDGFLSRRSAQFRSRLKRTAKKARRDGFLIEVADTGQPEALYARVMAVEERSWKGLRGVGINRGAMRAFYRLMMDRLLPSRLRLSFVRREEEDLAYVLGGVLGSTYRGLQFSYDQRFRDHGLGNVAQLHTIERLAAEGITTYDLGTDIAYKRRWGDGGLVTRTIIAVAR